MKDNIKPHSEETKRKISEYFKNINPIPKDILDTLDDMNNDNLILE